MFKLYKIKSEQKKSADCLKSDGKYKVEIFKPNMIKLSVSAAEKTSLKTKLLRLFFYLITLGDFEIYYTESDGKITHTSYVIGKCFKFAFMKKGDYEIGPCYTHRDYRGKGIYPCVLKTICETKCDGNIYIFTTSENTPSMKGIEKAGFKDDGTLSKSRFLKIYYR